MALLNDLKKLLFGAKAVTKSAAEKAVEAGKEAGKDLAAESSELFEKAKDRVEDIGKVVMDKADMAMDKAAGLAEDAGSKVMQAAEVAKAKAKDLADDFMGNEEDAVEPVESDDIMDEILAETKAAEPALVTEEETLELPPLKASTEPLLEAPDDEPDVFDSIKESASTAGDKIAETTGDALGKAGDFVGGVGKKVMETGANDVMVVTGPNKFRILVPYIPEQVIQSIDLESKTIVLDWHFDDEADDRAVDKQE